MNIEEDLTSLKEIVAIRKERCHGFIESDSCLISTKRLENLLTAYEKEKEKNKELSNSYDKLAKECNEENRRCMLLAVENQDLKEKNKELEKKLEEINDINFPTIN